MRCLLPLALGLCSSPAFATTARPVTLAELTREASDVVVARVEATRSAWQGGRIVTTITLHLDEVWAGSVLVGDSIEVDTLGGVVDGIGQQVLGAVRLSAGDHVVLFLEPISSRSFRVVEMAQGVFLVADPRTADPPLERRSFGIHLLGDGPRQTLPTTLRALERAVTELRRAP